MRNLLRGPHNRRCARFRDVLRRAFPDLKSFTLNAKLLRRFAVGKKCGLSKGTSGEQPKLRLPGCFVDFGIRKVGVSLGRFRVTVTQEPLHFLQGPLSAPPPGDKRRRRCVPRVVMTHAPLYADQPHVFVPKV
ncbi:MAG: hypothetical protein L6Q76_14505, partial [Polyangiaceae bacterium]|nr:hypothetical protein [Polyangiaceae bacterium]